MAQGIDFTASGDLGGAAGVSAVTGGAVVRVLGITAINTSATASAIFLREGSATGRILGWAAVPAKASTVDGGCDVMWHGDGARVSHQGVWVIVEGGTPTGTVWIG